MAKLSCPSCGYFCSWIVRGNKRKCKKCRREFSGKIYPVSGFRITKEAWSVAAKIFLRERTIKRLSEEVSVSMKTAQRIIVQTISQHAGWFLDSSTDRVPTFFSSVFLLTLSQTVPFVFSCFTKNRDVLPSLQLTSS